MYGTIGRTRIKPENRAELLKVFEKGDYHTRVPGYVTSHTLFEDGSDVMWMVAVFEDRASYERNAADSAHDERYGEYRALMEEDLQWHTGEIATI